MDSRLHQAHLRSTNNIRASPALPFRNSPNPSVNSNPFLNRTQIPPLGPDQKSRRVPELSRTTHTSTLQERLSTQKDSATRQTSADFRSKTVQFSKGTLDVLSKASEILQKSSKITIGSNVVPTTATSINFERAHYERPTPTPTTVQSQNFSSKTTNALGKADEILKRSLGYTRDSRVSVKVNGEHGSIPRESAKSVSENNIHVPLVHTYEKPKNYHLDTKPVVDQDKKMHNIFNRIDEALQRSLQITGSPKGISSITDLPSTTSNVNLNVRQPMPAQKLIEIGLSQDMLNQRNQSTEKNIRGYQEVPKRNHEVIRNENEIHSRNLTPKQADHDLNQGINLKSSFVMERRQNIESHSPLAENKTVINDNITMKEAPQSQASQPPPRVKKPKFVEEDYEDGTVYKGEKIREVKHGRGELLYPDGSRYEGEWENDRKNGYGVQTFTNGNIEYDGEWKDDGYHGNGVLMNETAQETRNFNYRDFETLDNHWIKYEGEFVNGKMHGLGTLTLFNNERHVGKFKNDKVHGVGVFHLENGEAVSAEWENNKLIRN